MNTPIPDPPPENDSGLTILSTGGINCWNQIGTSGDRSCPELQTHIHCRNCPVFASAARAFFDRPAPLGYLAEWTQWLSSSGEAIGQRGESAAGGEHETGLDRDRITALIFRLNREWLAFRTATVAEVTSVRPVHRIPHRSNSILIGLVNLRGQLQLCVSLHGLLGIEPASPRNGHSAQASLALSPPAREGQGVAEPPSDAAIASVEPGTTTRLVVLTDKERSEIWVFPAEEVLGVHALARGQVRGLPSTLANPAVSFSQAVLAWDGRSVAFLDEQRVFAALRSLGQ